MSEQPPFKPHALEWTPEKIARFWDYESQNKAKRGIYFTLQTGDALVRLARGKGVLNEPVLDYGAGVGWLSEKLARQGVRCMACDFSPASVEALNARLKDAPAFEGCRRIETLPTPLPADSFGLVYLVETLEHLQADWVARTLGEVRRLLRPGGHVLVTVPHDENLDMGQVICADCGAVFHRVQHVNSYNESSLTTVLEQAGFGRVFCQPLHLWNWSEEGMRHARTLRARLRRLVQRLRGNRSAARSTPHLIYIGRKA